MKLATFPEDEQTWLENFDRISENTAGAHLGIRLESINVEQIVLTMPISDKTRQPYGLLHGGITMALVESACQHPCQLGGGSLSGSPGGDRDQWLACALGD